MEERELRSMIAEVKAGRVSRRHFVHTMIGLGLTAPMAAQMLASAGVAHAQAKTPYTATKGAPAAAGDTDDVERGAVGQRSPRDGIETEAHGLRLDRRQFDDLDAHGSHVRAGAFAALVFDEFDQRFGQRQLVHRVPGGGFRCRSDEFVLILDIGGPRALT